MKYWQFNNYNRIRINKNDIDICILGVFNFFYMKDNEHHWWSLRILDFEIERSIK